MHSTSMHPAHPHTPRVALPLPEEGVAGLLVREVGEVGGQQEGKCQLQQDSQDKESKSGSG